MSRSNRYCSVPQCSSWEKKSSSINFHAFPQTGDKYRVSVEGKLGNKVLMDRQKAWQLKLKIGKPVTRNMKVCSLHFIDDDYFYRDSSSTQRRFLKKTAVPSRNLPVESTTTKEKPESSSSRSKRLRQRSINKEKLVTEECSREEIKRSVQTPSQDEIEVAQGLLQLRQDFPEIQKNMPKCFECDAMSSCVLKFSKILPEANNPVKGSTKAAGYDLKSAVECVVPPRGKALVDTGLVIELPERCYGRVAPRSGLAVKSFIDVGAGVIDEDYRGPLKVVLFNHGEEPFTVNVGDRIAQLICERIYYPELQEVDIRNW